MSEEDKLDPVAEAILAELGALSSESASLDPQDIARSLAATKARPKDPPDLWRRYLPAVRQQALYLGRKGRIAVLRKGKPVDPRKPVKGVIRLRLAKKGEILPPDGGASERSE
ncbi:MAG: DUF3253 domain-containing protein [Kiloniellales bacterium]|nr:DUF3253 domain-containing protein [Kiloniellales bacterium]